jgi:hypothetical protein
MEHFSWLYDCCSSGIIRAAYLFIYFTRKMGAKTPYCVILYYKNGYKAEPRVQP